MNNNQLITRIHANDARTKSITVLTEIPTTTHFAGKIGDRLVYNDIEQLIVDIYKEKDNIDVWAAERSKKDIILYSYIYQNNKEDHGISLTTVSAEVILNTQTGRNRFNLYDNKLKEAGM